MKISELLFYSFILSLPVVLPAQTENPNVFTDENNVNKYNVEMSEADTGYESDIAIDQQGYLHISYYDATNGDLKYARQIKGDVVFDDKFMNMARYGNWVVFTIDNIGASGRYSSIKIDSMSRPCISYYDLKNKALKFTRFDGQKWIIQYVDAGNVGIYTSLALDRSDRPYISYYDAKRGSLKCAKYNGFRWDTEEVDKENHGDLGLYTSIAIGVDGLARISYYDNRNGKLKFAKSRGNDWIIENVDTGENCKTGVFSSMALANNDTPHIAYYDTTNNNLKYAVKKGFTWEEQVVDSSKNVGQFASIKLDSRGYPWIAYYDSELKKLKLAQYNGVSWLTDFPVSTTNEFGMDCALVIDKMDNWHISCRDLKYRKLVYVNNKTNTNPQPKKKPKYGGSK
ncbi:MAG: hypothetical protein V1752_01005 [Candidatus Firestonebacteria bacterium]